MAVLTREGLLPRVNALVPDEVGYLSHGHRGDTYLGEGLRTVLVVASVGLLLVVHSCMFLQRRVLCERLVASGTIDRN